MGFQTPWEVVILCIEYLLKAVLVTFVEEWITFPLPPCYWPCPSSPPSHHLLCFGLGYERKGNGSPEPLLQMSGQCWEQCWNRNRCAALLQHEPPEESRELHVGFLWYSPWMPSSGNARQRHCWQYKLLASGPYVLDRLFARRFTYAVTLIVPATLWGRYYCYFYLTDAKAVFDSQSKLPKTLQGLPVLCFWLLYHIEVPFNTKYKRKIPTCQAIHSLNIVWACALCPSLGHRILDPLTSKGCHSSNSSLSLLCHQLCPLY